MCVGYNYTFWIIFLTLYSEKRKLVIPSHLAYGDLGFGTKIPGGATLIFEVQLVKIMKL